MLMDENYFLDKKGNNNHSKLLKSNRDRKRCFFLPLSGIILGIAFLFLWGYTQSSDFLLLGIVLLVIVLRIHPTVRKIYYSINADFIKETFKNDLFYGGLNEANKFLLRITKSSFNEINKENINHCYQIYLEVFIRSHGGLSNEFSTPKYITEQIQKNILFFQVVL